MYLDDTEIRDLSRALQRREPHPDWEGRVRDELARGLLGETLRGMAARHPDDATLAELATLVPPRTRHRLATASAVGMAAVVVAVALWGTRSVDSTELAAAPAAPHPVGEVAPAVPVTTTPLDLPVAAAVSSLPPRDPVDAAAGELAPTGCAGKHGMIGYWYAGPTAPGQVGDVVSLPRDVNVRADFPGRHNGFNARAAVRCVLLQGDQVALTEAPVLVPGAAYWVPLYLP